MTPRRLGLALVLSLLAPGAGAQTPAAPIAVTYRSETAVYVSGGRAAGIAVGDRLSVMSGREAVAELEVTFLAEHSSSCRILKQTQPVKRGDHVVRLGPPRPAPAASPAAPTAGPASSAAVETSPGTRRTPAPLARVVGGVSLGWSTFKDASDAGRDVEQRMARYDLALRDLGGRPLELRVRGNSRQSIRDNVRGFILPERERRDRLYELSVAWAPRDGRFSATGGRLGAHPFVSLGYLDGVLADVRPTSSVQIGGFLGRTPDAEDTGFDGGSKYGAFLRLAPEGGRRGHELVLAGVRENSAGEVSREYVTQEGNLRSGRLWLHERIEMDLNRGWRRDRAGAGTQLSEARVLGTWRASSTRAFTVSYERRRNFWSALTRSLPDAVFDRRIHQTFRADLDLSRPGGAGIWLGGSARTREGEDRVSYAAHAGLRSPQFLSLGAASVEGSYYQTVFTQGFQAAGRLGRDFRGGHRIDVSYTLNNYDTLGQEDRRTSHWLRFSGYGQLARKAYARADVEYALGDDLQGTRVILEAGYRF